MERSLCLLVIMGVFVCLGEAQIGGQDLHWPWQRPRPHGPWPASGGSWPQPNLPEGVTQICGASTSPELAADVSRALRQATEYSFSNRNDAGGWTTAPFVSTARAIMNLQLSSDGEWYSQQTMDEQPNQIGRWFGQQTSHLRECRTNLSVRQLEVEVLTFLTRYLNGEDSLELMGHTEFASNLVALSLTCHNIFDFFGHNLYNVMNERLRRFGDGVTVGAPLTGTATNAPCDSLIPGGAANRDFFYGFGLLVACQSADVINPDFFRCAIEAQNNGLYLVPLVIPGLGPYPLGYGDLQLLGMSCLSDRVPIQFQNQWSAIMTQISTWMIGMQDQTGSFAGNPIATILAIQSLKSAEASFNSWNCEGAVRNLLSLQNDEGQIADSLGLTMLALPTLSGRSMADVNEIRPECNNPNA